MKKQGLLMVIMSFLIFIVSACGAEDQDNPASAKHTSIQVALATDSKADQLDAAGYDGVMALYGAVYDPLVEYGEKGEIIPGLAKSWEVSENGKTYTFHLREDVRFSDGSDFDADAVIFSMNRWVGDEAHSWLHTVSNLDEVKKEDDYTVIMNFARPSPLILNELTAARPLRIMSPNSVEPAGDPKGEFIEAVGTGAWKIDSYTKDKETVLTPNKYYWGEKPTIEKMIWKVIENPQTRSLALQEGSIDISGSEMGKISYESLPTFKGDEQYTVEEKPGTMSYFLVVNNQNEKLQDVKVRQALNYAINKKSLADDILDSNGLAAKGLFAETVPFVTTENSPGYAYNPEKAKKLLEEAGYGANGETVELNLALQTDEFPEWKQISETIQANLKEVGIETTLDNMESTAYYDNLWGGRDYDLLIYRTYADGLNPQGFLDSMFVTQDDGLGVAFTDETLSNAIIEAGKEVIDEDRQAAYNQVLTYINDNAVTVPLFYPHDIIVRNNKVDNFTWGPIIDDPVVWHKLNRGE